MELVWRQFQGLLDNLETLGTTVKEGGVDVHCGAGKVQDGS
jgi:hypothetical protein